MKIFKGNSDLLPSVLAANKIPNLIIYFLLLTAIVVSVIFYLFPFQNEFSSSGQDSKVYFADNITQAHSEIIAEFNKKYRGKIEVIPIDIPTLQFTTNKRKELITRTLRSRNSRIDIFAVDQIWVPRFTKWAEPLEQFFSEEELKLILPQALKTCYFNDKLYAIPFFIDAGLLYYRTDIIGSLPESEKIEEKLEKGISWTDIIEIKKRYFPGKYAYIFQGDAYEGLICNFIEFLGNDTERLYSGNKFNIFDPVIIEKTRQFADLIYKHKIAPVDVTTFDEGRSFEYALNNDIPFFRGWPTTVKYSNLVSKTTQKLNLLKEASLPGNGKNAGSSAIGGWNFILSRYSGVKEEAVTFIKFVLSEKIQELNYTSGSYLPILKSFYENKEMLEKHPKSVEFRTILNNGVHRPAMQNYTKISDIISLYLNKALKKELTTETALKKAQQKIDLILNSSQKIKIGK